MYITEKVFKSWTTHFFNCSSMQALNLLLDIKEYKHTAGPALFCRIQETRFSATINKHERARNLSFQTEKTKSESLEK